MLVGVKRSDYKTIATGYVNLQNELQASNSKHDTLQKEYDDYKAKMQPYESIQLEDAKNKTEKESRELAEKKAAEEQAADEAKAAEEARGYETGITFDNLARTPDAYKGKKVKFSGKVIQVIEGTTETQLRLAISGDYNKVIFCRVSKAKTSATRILEDDHGCF